MDKRFYKLRPQTCKNPAFGSEPSLFDIIEHYYISHGIDPTTANKLTTDYVQQWLKMESSNDEGSEP
jgi:hypothetical protein